MERQTTKQKNQEHCNIATLSLQLRSYKNIWFQDRLKANKKQIGTKLQITSPSSMYKHTTQEKHRMNWNAESSFLPFSTIFLSFSTYFSIFFSFRLILNYFSDKNTHVAEHLTALAHYCALGSLRI